MYPMVGNEYVIAHDFKIDVDTYELMRSRPYKRKGLFIRDTCSILWTLQERARRCLNLEKCAKEIPGLKVAEPRKVALAVRKSLSARCLLQKTFWSITAYIYIYKHHIFCSHSSLQQLATRR